MSNIEIISDILNNMGVPAHLLGYDYTIKAVELITESNKYHRATVSRLYPDIAKCFGTAPNRVERAIRHAIEVAFTRNDAREAEKLFGCSIDPNKGKPTNGQFIATVAKRYKLIKEEGSQNGKS